MGGEVGSGMGGSAQWGSVKSGMGGAGIIWAELSYATQEAVPYILAFPRRPSSMVEHVIRNDEVEGSSPSGGFSADVAQ